MKKDTIEKAEQSLKVVKKRKKRTKYLTNAELLEEFEKYWETGIISNDMAVKIQKLAKKIASRGNFSGYYFKQDMIQDALSHATMKGVPGFKQGRTNPFAYLSQVIFNKYREIIKLEKKNLTIFDSVRGKLSEDMRIEVSGRL